MVWACTPFARFHEKLATVPIHQKHLLRRISIKLTMQPANKIRRRRFRQTLLVSHKIELGLDAYMRSRLSLQIATLFVLVELASERTRNVDRPRVMAFDEVAVIRVHDPHEIGEVRGGTRIERVLQLRRRRRKLGYDVGNRLGSVLETCRLDALDALGRRFFGRFSCFHNAMYINDKV